MHCPKCKVKMMVREKKKKSEMLVHCIECGSEFILREGRLLQKKKSKKIIISKKIIKKGVTITPASSLNSMHNQGNAGVADALKRHRDAQKHLEHVQKLNEQARRMRQVRKPPGR